MADTPGTYCGKPVSIKVCETSTHKPIAEVQFAISHMKPEGCDWTPVEPMTRKVGMFLTEAALPYSTKKLQACGFNGDYASPIIDGSKSVELWAKEDGEFTRWDVAPAAKSTVRAALEPSALQALNAQWAAEFGAPAPVAPAPVPQAPSAPVAPPPPPPFPEDEQLPDLPF